MIRQTRFISSFVMTVIPLSAPAMAAPDDHVSLWIRSQPLESALSEFAQQSGVQLLFAPSEQTSNAVAPELSGEFRVDTGLRRLLSPFGLSYEFVNDKTVAIQGRQVRLAANGSAKEVVSGSVPQSEDQRSTSNEPLPVSTSDTRASEGRVLPEVLISGSRSLNADIARTKDDIQPYIVLDREAIERTAAADIVDLFRTAVPANMTLGSPSLNGAVSGNRSSIDLRGLGSSQTLVLVDGRRQGSSSSAGDLSQPDLNSIPLSAIERIEILPVSASGIYGGTATGGVVNVVLRRDYKGFEVGVTHDDTFNGSSVKQRVDFAGGFGLNNGRTTMMLSGSYLDADPLQIKDRDFYDRGVAMILQNNPSLFLSGTTPPLGATSNVRSFSGANLVLKTGGSLGSPIAYVPDGYRGASSDGGAAFRQTAGSYNLKLADSAQGGGGGDRYLFTGSTIKSLRATVRQEFSNWFSAFVEVSGSENNSRYLANSMTSTFVIPSTAPNNPFTENIRVTTAAVGSDGLQRSSYDENGQVLGGIFRLPWKDWSGSLEFSRHQTKWSFATSGFGISTAGQTAITSGAVDVLRDTNVYAVDFSAYHNSDQLLRPVKSTLYDGLLRFGGGLLDVPGGSLDLTTQFERNRQRLGDYVLTYPWINQVYTAAARVQTVNSAYAELRLPIVGAPNSRPGLRLLELQAAARYDSYVSDASNATVDIGGVRTNARQDATNRFSSTVPTFGIRYSPAKDITVRGSYGEGFLPPSLTALAPNAPVILPTGFPILTDPRRGNERLSRPLTVLSGGNPNLNPETSRSKSFGLVLTPRFVPGLRLSVDWAEIQKADNITSFGLGQFVLDNEQYLPGAITRGPTLSDGFTVGPIQQIDVSQRNIAKLRVETYDWRVDYTWTTDRWGRFSVGGSATQAVEHATQLLSNSPESSLAGISSYPEWSAAALLTWDLRNVSLNWNTQYFGPFWYRTDHAVDPSFKSARSPSAIYHDLSAKYRFSGSGGTALQAMLSNTELLVGVRNIFNTQPRISLENLSSYYDSRADPRLATYFLTLKKSF